MSDVQYTKNQAVNKFLPFELIFAVYSEYKVTSNCVGCTHFYWTYMCSTQRTQPSKSGFYSNLYVQYTKNTITMSDVPIRPYPVQYTKNQTVKKWLQFELIIRAYFN